MAIISEFTIRSLDIVYRLDIVPWLLFFEVSNTIYFLTSIYFHVHQFHNHGGSLQCLSIQLLMINMVENNDSSVQIIPVIKSDDPAELYFVISHYFQCVMTLATFMYGVTSWCLIKKFRNFNNYVYLNAVFVNILRLTLGIFSLIRGGIYLTKLAQYINIYFFILMFFSAVYNYWLVVMCYIFYVDIVKVFDTDIKWKYFKSSLFAWGVPFIFLVICKSVLLFVDLTESRNQEIKLTAFAWAGIMITSNVFPTIINLVLYVKIVCNLFPCNDTVNVIIPKKERMKQNVCRLLIATCMFVLNNLFVICMLVWDLWSGSDIVRAVSFCLQIVVLSLFVPLVKSNRTLWQEYFKKRLKSIMT